MDVQSPTQATVVSVIERVKSILRRDLKLGADMPLEDDTLLVGGDLDVDSLDVLLVLVSLEKAFGVKLAHPSLGKHAFTSVRSLAQFIEAGGVTGAEQAAAPRQNLEQMLGALPHGEPFRFITRLVAVEPRKSGEGLWRVSGSEAFFAGHFPGRPLVPGVLLSEALAQLSGIVAAAGATQVQGSAGRLAHVDVRFTAPVQPPAEIVLRARAMHEAAGLHQFQVAALVGELIVAEGTVTLAIDPASGAEKP